MIVYPGTLISNFRTQKNPGFAVGYAPPFTPEKKNWSEVEGIDNASVIIRHLSVGITAQTVMKPIITNIVNLVHTKK